MEYELTVSKNGNQHTAIFRCASDMHDKALYLLGLGYTIESAWAIKTIRHHYQIPNPKDLDSIMKTTQSMEII